MRGVVLCLALAWITFFAGSGNCLSTHGLLTTLAPRARVNSKSNLAASNNLAALFPIQYFSQPLDHFGSTSNVTFQQRYWVNSRHYVSGGPVICLDSGESSGTARLPYLDTGIADILAEATHGLAIILEHRYYGGSVPTANFTTDSLRWLTTEQSLADSANLIANFKWNGTDLSGPGTKWIYYGACDIQGSYAGARSALMRVIYPDLVFGAIASSGVTRATVDYWGYYEAIRTTANQTCMSLLTESIASIDASLTNNITNPIIKALFGLSGLSDGDFGAVLTTPPSAVQDENWDPTQSDNVFVDFCQSLGSGNATSHVKAVRVSAAVRNYATWMLNNVVGDCALDPSACFSVDPVLYAQSDLSQTWRPWTWQYCTQWGFFATAPPDPNYPRIVSASQTHDYAALICTQAFPPGQYASVPAVPDVEAINKYGGFNIAKDRLAFVDGYYDPWRRATPHSPTALPRADTVQRPFKLISDGVHHWDENGLANHTSEPPTIKLIHAQEVAFVRAWLRL